MITNANRTLKELRDAIKIDMQLDPGLISDGERNQFINDCLRDLGAINLFEKTRDLISVEGIVTPPTDFIQIITLSWSNGAILRPLQARAIQGTGTPYGYIFKSNAIALYPKPTEDDMVSLYYQYRPALLVKDDDQPDIPNGYDSLIVDYAVAKAHRKNGNIALFREYMGFYDNKKMDLMSELTRRSNSRITPMYNQDGIDDMQQFPYKLI